MREQASVQFQITVENARRADDIGRIVAALARHGFFVSTELRTENGVTFPAIVSSQQEGWSDPAIAHVVSAVAEIEGRTVEQVLESVREQADRLQKKFSKSKAQSTE